MVEAVVEAVVEAADSSFAAMVVQLVVPLKQVERGVYGLEPQAEGAILFSQLLEMK